MSVHGLIAPHAARSSTSVDVHGFLAGGGTVWIADNTGGRLYRIAKG